MARVLGAATVPRRRHQEPPVWMYLGLRIRRYVPDDLPTVFALHRECLAQVGLRSGDGVYYDDDFARMEEVYLRARGEFLVGEVDGEIAAIGGLRRVDDAVAEMVRLRVRPDEQGKGYGAAVVTVLEERAAELGYRVLRADTTVKQPVALELYRSFGWSEVDRRITGETVTVYFERSLLRPEPQPQAPPQQPPPPGGGGAADLPATATVDRSFTVSSWPPGQVAGAFASLIGRDTSNVEPQARQRKS